MMDIKLTKTHKNILTILVIGSGVIFFIIYSYLHDEEYEKFGRYTQGTIVKIERRPKATILYTFEVDGKVYEGDISLGSILKPEIGDVYLVKYSSRDPTINTMVMTHEDAKKNKGAKILYYYNNSKPIEE